MSYGKPLLAIVLMTWLPVQAESYYFARIGAGVNTILFSDTRDWDPDDQLGCAFGIGNRHHLTGAWHGEISYHHYSQCFVGPPFDDAEEDSLDAFYYFLEYRF